MQQKSMQKTVAAMAIALIALTGAMVGTCAPAVRVSCHTEPVKHQRIEGGLMISGGKKCEWRGEP